MRFHLLCGSLAFGALLYGGTAFAHIRMTAPITRYPAPATEDGSDLKNSPCGRLNGVRTTDPTRINTFTPGQQITVSWAETVGHPGHYRIAFDDVGQDDLADPASYTDLQQPGPHILLDGIPDIAGAGTYSKVVTLPNIQCNNCTLQVIQVMTDKPPYAPNTNDVYHQCADLVLSGPLLGSGGASSGGASSGGASSGGTSSGAGGSGEAGASTAGSGASTAGSGASTAGSGASAGGSSGSSGTTGFAGDSVGIIVPDPEAMDGANGSSKDGGGCAIAASSGQSSTVAGVLGLLGLAAFAARRRGL